MKPTAETANRTSSLPLRTLLSVSLVLMLSLLLGGTFEYLRLQDRAAEQANEISRAFGRSSAVLIQPLVLSDDRISLNYLLNELTRQPLINGMRLTAPDQTLIALAGDAQGRMHTLELLQGDVPLGQLTLWSNAAAFSTPLRDQLLETALLLFLCLTGAATLIALSLRRNTSSERATEPSFAEVKAAFEQPRDSDRIPDFTFDLDSDPEPLTETSTPQPGRSAPARPSQTTGESSSIPAIGPAPDVEQGAEPMPADSDAPPDLQSELESLEKSAAEDSAANGNKQDQLDTGELVSLLKPERSDDSIPRFTPRAPGADLPEDDVDEAMVPSLGSATDDDFTVDELGPAEPANTRLNPLQLSDEEQLGLYTFEQELELLLTPEEAGYLLLIDTRSAHSDNVEDEERNQLLRNYRTLANSAARIYSGEISALKDGNLRILFTEGDDKDSHGINALCCAMLFTYLYKQYNQRQIRAFQPVMNLHMALVRGASERVDRMQEEAHFLTRTTQSNELISHTALTEAPLLKEMLLQKADIRREDEDKVLILSISDAYQTLLEKQARHLLSKLSERERGNTGA
ncbi:hypothetical protein [Marinobacterium sediminicola]|uniref:Membrane protein affecting hemolysin expression n=1 Tax=Marinobacterium sediminicola TaxID=518898 RepID=A0ABY1S0C5_9GAMM|nr:hypothetical protein [Marinobacterium sediminicola]ULG69620.1 hypothetical protein LN244_02040 [Marinobacterium sediminicola]SMR74652.1 hypothetical protein SAMN04487964_107116 [Marinobacterium sediminicola]